MNRQQRRAAAKGRLKVIQGEKPAGNEVPDTPAARFARSLHQYLVTYYAKHPDLARTEACAAALQVASGLALDVGGDREGFLIAAGHFYDGEANFRATRGPQ